MKKINLFLVLTMTMSVATISASQHRNRIGMQAFDSKVKSRSSLPGRQSTPTTLIQPAKNVTGNKTISRISGRKAQDRARNAAAAANAKRS